ncbi:MAG: tetratricopeptide repeat protein [Deltaproteobacteria bacterium]|nr:tetratricopeptide repeat protein [Deltaproteobacteria bacterium]
MAPRRYFFRTKDGTLLGPVNLNVVAEMIRSGKVKSNTPVSLDGHDFRPMKSFPELATLLSVDVDLPDASEADDVLETPPTYSGSIQEVSIPKLLYHFTASKAVGRILLTNEKIRKEVYLLNGKPVAASSTLLRDRLASHLVRKGALNKAKATKLIAQIGDDDVRLGDHLLHSGVLKPNELFDHLKEQLLEKIYELFTWRMGTYAFFEGQEYKGTLLPLNLNPWEIIAQGVRSGYRLQELQQLLEPLRNRILLPRSNEHLHMSQLLLHPRESKVFKSVTAGRTLGAILDRLGGTREQDAMVLSMIYMGIELELIGLGDEAIEEPFLAEGEAFGSGGDKWDQMIGRSFSNPSPPSAPSSGPSASSPGSQVKSEEERELESIYAELKSKNYFERLGLDQSTSSGQVSKAFLKAARAYHPDQTPASAPDSVRQLRSDIFSLFNEAQQTLVDDRRRASYIEGLASGHEGGEVDVTHIVQSEMLFQKGEVLLSSRKYTEALKEFEEAIRLNPDEGEFIIYKGYALYCTQQNPDTVFARQCIDMIERGLKMRNDNVANGYLFLGRIYKAQGDADRAQKLFKKTLSIERNHLEASRELRVLNMRKEKKGFWRKK